MTSLSPHFFQEWASIEQGNGLFDAFINTALKRKVEASGWPSNVSTEEEKRAFVKEYLEEEGIQLDPHNIILNAAVRSIEKLKMNS